MANPHSGSAQHRPSQRWEAAQTVCDGNGLFDDDMPTSPAASASTDSEYAATAREQFAGPWGPTPTALLSIPSTPNLSMSQRPLRRQREDDSTDNREGAVDADSDHVATACKRSAEPCIAALPSPIPSASEPSTSESQGRLRHQREESTGKCRRQEVDYSQGLRKVLYEKEELLGDFRRYLRNLKTTYNEEIRVLQEQNRQLQLTAEVEIHGQKSKMSELQEFIQKREQTYADERNNLQTQIHSDRATLTSQYRLEVEKLREEMKAELDARLQEAASTTVKTLELKNQELNEQLNRAQAEKETELANIEQRYRWREPKTTLNPPTSVAANSDGDESGMDEPDRAHSQAPGSVKSPRAGLPKHRAVPSPAQPPAHVTPNLNAIKRLRKVRGISRRSHLVGIKVPDDQPMTSRESTAEPEIPQTNAPTVQMPEIIDAVTKGVQTALQSMFGNDGKFHKFSPQMKRSPKRKRMVNEEVEQEKRADTKIERDFYLHEVRRVFKKNFSFSQDIDFITAQSAPPGDVHEYQYEDGPGPDAKNPVFDLYHNAKSPWNQAVVDILLEEVNVNSVQEGWSFQRSDAYIRDAIVERYKHLRTIWRNAQPKLTDKGTLETPAEIEARIVLQREEVLKEARKTTRRRSKYTRRIAILDHIVKLKTEGNDDDLEAWQWLYDLVWSLGEHGMSSEESSVENEVEDVLRVKRMMWRRPIERELELIDLQRLIDIDIFLPQGSRPMKRIRAQNNPVSSRSAPKGLPEALYDRGWLVGLAKWEREALGISSDVFPWMTVAVA